MTGSLAPAPTVPAASKTFPDALVDALVAAGAYNEQDQEAAILWPDKECYSEALLPRLRERLRAQPATVVGS